MMRRPLQVVFALLLCLGTAYAQVPPAPGVRIKQAGTVVGQAAIMNIVSGGSAVVDGTIPGQINLTISGSGGSPAGPTGAVQVNGGGSFAGSSSFTITGGAGMHFDADVGQTQFDLFNDWNVTIPGDLDIVTAGSKGISIAASGGSKIKFADGSMTTNGVGDMTLMCDSSLTMGNAAGGAYNVDADGSLDLRANGIGTRIHEPLILDDNVLIGWGGFGISGNGTGTVTVAGDGSQIIFGGGAATLTDNGSSSIVLDGGGTITATVGSSYRVNGLSGGTADFEGFGDVEFGLDGGIGTFRVATSDSTEKVNLAGTQVNGNFTVAIGGGSNTVSIFADQVATFAGSSGVVVTSDNGGATLNSDVGTVNITAPQANINLTSTNAGVYIFGNGVTAQFDGGGDPGIILSAGNSTQFRVSAAKWLDVDPGGTGAITLSTVAFGGGSVDVKGNTTLNLYANISDGGADLTIQNFGVSTGDVALVSNHAIVATAPTFKSGPITAFDFSPSSGPTKTGSGAVSINGAVTFAANKGIVYTSGTGAADFSNGSGITKTTSGAFTSVASSNTFNNLVTLSGHLAGSGTAPTIAAGTGAGTSPTVSITGTDLNGVVSVTTGTLPTLSGTVVTVTFNVAYASAPRDVIWIEANSNAALLSGVTKTFVNSAGITTTTFAVTAGTTALTAATAYKWYYVVVQ